MGTERHKTHSETTMLKLAFLALTLLASVRGQLNTRTPRLFLVSTSATTSTLSTNTVCFTTGAAAATTCAKRKRSIVVEGAEGGELEISPSRSDMENDSGVVGSQREGRLANGLLYWITTTTTSTLTSFTSTITIATLECTPAGSTLSVCGK